MFYLIVFFCALETFLSTKKNVPLSKNTQKKKILISRVAERNGWMKFSTQKVSPGKENMILKPAIISLYSESNSV